MSDSQIILWAIGLVGWGYREGKRTGEPGMAFGSPIGAVRLDREALPILLADAVRDHCVEHAHILQFPGDSDDPTTPTCEEDLAFVLYSCGPMVFMEAARRAVEGGS